AAQPAPGRVGAAERLRPRHADERLWAPVDRLALPPESDEARMRERLAGRIGTWNDSIAAEEEAARRALDWTVKGKNGERWGISPAGIHLGTITLPAPVFAGNAEAAARAREWNEIQGQADHARIRDRFDDRVRAIRERKDAERAARKPPNGGNDGGN
ncbi:MAG: hypothetical protein ACRELD_02960, partial [Longimicrobiales bacterium]